MPRARFSRWKTRGLKKSQEKPRGLCGRGGGRGGGRGRREGKWTNVGYEAFICGHVCHVEMVGLETQERGGWTVHPDVNNG